MPYRTLVRYDFPLKTKASSIWVRSHPVSVLPSTGGRYSPEFNYPVYLARFKIQT